MAQKKKAAHRTSPALVLLIAALVIFLGIELIQVGQRLSEARQQQAADPGEPGAGVRSGQEGRRGIHQGSGA